MLGVLRATREAQRQPQLVQLGDATGAVLRLELDDARTAGLLRVPLEEAAVEHLDDARNYERFLHVGGDVRTRLRGASRRAGNLARRAAIARARSNILEACQTT